MSTLLAGTRSPAAAAAADPGLPVPDRAALRRLSLAALQDATLTEAIQVAWPGWQVTWIHPYRDTQGFPHHAVLLRHPTGGWAATLVSGYGNDPVLVDELLAGTLTWTELDPPHKKAALRARHNQAVVAAGDLADLAARIHTTGPWADKPGQRDHRSFLWRMLTRLPVAAEPTADTVRLLMALWD